MQARRGPNASALAWVLLTVAAGCAASPSGSAGTGGRSPGTGGGATAGTGGSASGGSGPGTGGAGGAPALILGMGPHPFPQNRKPGSCMLPTATNPAASVQAAYNAWKSAFVTSSGAGAGLRVRRNANGDDTVSEGIGYGMLAAVYLADRTTFDGLWTYAQAHLDVNGLMSWQISAGGTATQAFSATDGDVDMTWALIMGSEQWSSPPYLDAARKLINAITTSSIGPDGVLAPGDHWGTSNALTNPSYFSPAYFRVFAVVTGNKNWSGAIIDRNYQILAAVSGTQGLVPDWTTNQNALNQGLLMGSFDSSTYGYDACRTPWRIAMDYCFNNESRAKDYLMKVGAFFNNIGATNIVDGYSLTGSPKGSGDKNMSFIGTAGSAAMVGFPTLLNGAFTYGAATTTNDYFKDSLRVLTMLMMSGNFLDYSKPLP